MTGQQSVAGYLRPIKICFREDMTTPDSVIKVVAVMEATTVTGPAKNMINFFRGARGVSNDSTPRVDASIITFVRASELERVKDKKYPNVFVERATEAGIEVDIVPERFRFDPRVVSHLREIIARRNPHLIQTHHVKSHFLMRESKLWQTLPWIAFHHGYTATDAKVHVYNQLDRWSLRVPERVVTVCRPFLEELTAKGIAEEKISIMHNSVAPIAVATAAELTALKERHRIHPDDRVLLTIGRLSREKAQGDLVAALAELCRNRKSGNLKLLIVGDGPDRGHLEHLVRHADLVERVVFVGHVNDVHAYFALADVVVVPSHSEGSPNVVLEAMAAAKPIVATRVGGVPELVTDRENGLLVAPGNLVALAAAINSILSDSSLAERLAAKGRAFVSQRHTLEAYRMGLIGIYNEVLSRTSKKRH